jgi:hypothetical protein
LWNQSYLKSVFLPRFTFRKKNVFVKVKFIIYNSLPDLAMVALFGNPITVLDLFKALAGNLEGLERYTENNRTISLQT